VPGPEGAPAEWIGTVVDAHDRTVAEAALADSEARLRLATEAGEVGIFDWNLETGELHWDARLRAIFAVPEDAPVSIETFHAGLHPEDRARLEETIRASLDPAGDGEYAADFRVIGARDGVERHVEARGRAVFAGGARCA